MKRFISSLALLTVIALIGCEKYESPVAPPSQEQQVKSPTGFDAKASTEQLKEKVEAWKAKVEERAAALKMQAAKQRQLQSSIPQVAGGSKITVPDDYSSIQAAVTAASPGTKIIVKDGTYTEEVIISGKNNLTITAAHEGQTHVIGGFRFDGVIKGKLEGFDLTGGAGLFDGVFLRNCTKIEIKDNKVTGGLGITLYASEGCMVKDNEVSSATDGIVLPAGVTIYSGGKNSVEGNEVHTNIFGILVQGGLTGDDSPGRNVISANECTGNLVGIGLSESHENDLGDNECNANSQLGIELYLSHRNKIGSGNEANNNGRFGISVSLSNDNLVKKNEAHGNGICDAIDNGTGNTFKGNDFGSFNCP